MMALDPKRAALAELLFVRMHEARAALRGIMGDRYEATIEKWRDPFLAVGRGGGNMLELLHAAMKQSDPETQVLLLAGAREAYGVIEAESRSKTPQGREAARPK